MPQKNRVKQFPNCIYAVRLSYANSVGIRSIGNMYCRFVQKDHLWSKACVKNKANTVLHTLCGGKKVKEKENCNELKWKKNRILEKQIS